MISNILRKIRDKFKEDPLFSLFLVFLVSLALWVRFYNYHDRVSTISDNAIAVQVGRYAADNGKLPLAGQFSSAGPFYWGPWYYILMEAASFIPAGFFTHWYFISFFYLVFILFIYLLGYWVGGKWTGALASLFAAISPAQTSFSLSAWSPAIIPFLALISLIFLVRFYRQRKMLDAFLVGLVVSLSITIHFQGAMLLPVILMVLTLIARSGKNWWRFLFLMALGFLIPFLPLLYLDLRFDWYNLKNILIYLLVDQYKVWIPNRWLTYVSSYWPDAWGYIIGGNKVVGALLMGMTAAILAIGIKSFKKYPVLYLVGLVFLLEFVMYRYFRGQRFIYYSLFAHPAVLVLSAAAIVRVFQFQRLLGLFILSLVFFSTLNITKMDLADRGITQKRIDEVKHEIYSKYPNSQFDIYGCELNPNSVSYPMALSMYVDGRNKVGGLKISICESNNIISWIDIDKEYERDYKGKVYNRSTETVYKDTAEWFIKNPPLKGEGDYFKFLRENSPLWPF